MAQPVDFRAFNRLKDRINRAAIESPKLFKFAIISAQRAAKTEFSKATRDVFNVRLTTLQSNISVEAGAGLSFDVEGKGTTASIASFGATQTKKGISYQIKKLDSRQVAAGAFFAGTKNQRFKGVPFKRVGGDRLPLKVLYGPSVSDMFRNPAVSKPAIRRTTERAKAIVVNRFLKSIRK